ncbi:MAG: hypothetical protein R2911_21540 [Caldilineaceae bacterium]
MEWTKQFEEMSKTWAQTQQKMWSNWAETAQSMGQKQAGAAWRDDRRLADVDESTAGCPDRRHAAVGGQCRCVAQYPQAHAWMLMCSDMTQHWTDTQKQLWNNWFELVKEFNPEKLAPP